MKSTFRILFYVKKDKKKKQTALILSCAVLPSTENQAVLTQK